MDMLLPIVVGAGILIFFIVASKYLTQFTMNGGKTPEQIIESHKDDDANKRFLVKYPEADIRTTKMVLLALGFIFAFGTSVYAFKYKNTLENNVTLANTEIDEDFEVDAPPTEQVKPPPPPPPPPPPEIEVVDDDEILEDEPEIEDLEVEADEEIEIPEAPEEEPEEEVKEEKIFLVVEDMPKFKGCENLSGEAAKACTGNKIREFAAKVEFPDAALSNDIEGKVYVSFVVGKDGKITDVELLRGVHKLLDNAALRHIKNMPKFASPGKQRGKSVRVKYQIPIVFQIG